MRARVPRRVPRALARRALPRVPLRADAGAARARRLCGVRERERYTRRCQVRHRQVVREKILLDLVYTLNLIRARL